MNSMINKREIYEALSHFEAYQPGNEIKCNTVFGTEQDSTCWQYMYYACFNTIKDNTYMWFHYRIIQRILGTNHLLKKIKVTNTDLCQICGEQAETLVHLFSQCEKICDLWYDVIWIRSKIKVNLTLTKNIGFRLH